MNNILIKRAINSLISQIDPEGFLLRASFPTAVDRHRAQHADMKVDFLESAILHLCLQIFRGDKIFGRLDQVCIGFTVPIEDRPEESNNEPKIDIDKWGEEVAPGSGHIQHEDPSAGLEHPILLLECPLQIGYISYQITAHDQIELLIGER